MRAFRTSTAGIGLAALGALGLSALAMPAYASNSAFFGWVPWGNPNGPLPSVYAQQAIALAQQAGQTLDLPGGITYLTQNFDARGNTAVIGIQLPQGYVLSGCPSVGSVTTDGGGGFTSVLSVGCYHVSDPPPYYNNSVLTQSGSNGDVIEVTVQVGGSPTTPIFNTTGSIHLGVVTIDGTSPGLATLNPAGTLLANPNKTTTWCDGVAASTPACEIFGAVLQSPSGLLAGLQSALMAQSRNAKGVATLPPSYSGYRAICVDMTYAYAPGEEFLEGADCDNASNQSVADKGMIVIDLLALEPQHQTTPYDRDVFRDPEGPTIIVQGRCGGLKLENIGSVDASCGLLPFTGENAWLIPVDVNGQNFPETYMAANAPPPNFWPGGPHTACPLPDSSAGAGSPPAGTKGAIKGTITGPGQVTFDLTSVTHPGKDYEPTFPPGQLPDGSDWVAYYEFCDYATETAVIADSAGWFVSANFDCAPNSLADCTMTHEDPAADHLLPIQVNGAMFYVNFTNGAYNQQAFLRIVNDMHDKPRTSDVNSTCVNDSNQDAYNADLADSVLNCEPTAQVICKVTTDDGFNGYASLYTNGNGLNGITPSNSTGLHTGKNDIYPVWEIFANAGVPQGPFSDPNNVYNFGSLICFHPYGVYITQVQIDSNGTVVNIK